MQQGYRECKVAGCIKLRGTFRANRESVGRTQPLFPGKAGCKGYWNQYLLLERAELSKTMAISNSMAISSNTGATSSPAAMLRRTATVMVCSRDRTHPATGGNSNSHPQS